MLPAPNPAPPTQRPTAPAPPANLQPETLRAYTLLQALRPLPHAHAWPGALILNLYLDTPGAALSLAANIAGAVSLTVDPDPARARAALRAGACDFVVNTLDEALRAIKNETRQHRPLSVGLEGQPVSILDEILARGVAPQLFTSPSEHPARAARLASYGTRLIDLRAPATPEPINGHATETAQAILNTFVSHQRWTSQTHTRATPAELRAFDAQALALLPPGDHLRRIWLTSAPRLFPRDRTRTLWLTEPEATHLNQPAPADPD